MKSADDRTRRPGRSTTADARVSALPSIDRLLRHPAGAALVTRFGRSLTADVLRAVVAARRAALSDGRATEQVEVGEAALADAAARLLAARERASPLPVFNLSGTILHTNLGRAVLPAEAVEAVHRVAVAPSALEFDLETGRRGDRERAVVERLCRLTGAEDATLVNNNAAAVLLCLATLARRKEVLISRGELVEIGGAFRMPDIMASAGVRMREVGTTNRTHPSDFAEAIGHRTALLLKVHTSNYVISGFTAAVPEQVLSALAHDNGLPLMVDLGSGALTDLARYGLPQEPTPMQALAAGADLVTFSGDKLLGGPQAGLIVGRRDLVAKLARNPLKRALRLDKLTLAALDAVLQLYEQPEQLRERLPTLRHLTRPIADIEAQARRVVTLIAAALPGGYAAAVAGCSSEVGSGSLPMASLASAAVTVRATGRGGGSALRALARAFRSLRVPVIGRIAEGSFWLDLRCLDDEAGLVAQLPGLREALETAT